MRNIIYKLSAFIYKFFIGEMGADCKIFPFQNLYNSKKIKIGSKVSVGSNCRLNVCDEYNNEKYNPNIKFKISIGDNSSLGNNCFISANKNVVVGKNCIFSAFVFVTDHDHILYKNNKLINALSEGEETIIGDNVFVGVKASILKGVEIGDNSIIGANTVVTKSVPANSICVGNPGKVIKTYD